MKGHFVTVSDVRKPTRYVLRVDGMQEGEEPPVIVAGALPGSTTAQLVAWLQAVAARRPGVGEPFLHFSMGVLGERYPREKWEALSKACLVELKLDPEVHPYFATLHSKEDGQDCHCIVSRVSITGELFCPSWGVFAFIEACQRVEREHGLKLTPGFWDMSVDADRRRRTAPSAKVINLNRRAARLGLPLIDDVAITEVIGSCAARAIDVESFIALAGQLDVEISLRTHEDGSVKGFAVRQASHDRWVSMSSMTRRAFNWAQVMTRLEINRASGKSPDLASAMPVPAEGDAVRSGDVEKSEKPEAQSTDGGPEQDSRGGLARADDDRADERVDDQGGAHGRNLDAEQIFYTAAVSSVSAARDRLRGRAGRNIGAGGASTPRLARLIELEFRAILSARAETEEALPRRGFARLPRLALRPTLHASGATSRPLPGPAEVDGRELLDDQIVDNADGDESGAYDDANSDGWLGDPELLPHDPDGDDSYDGRRDAG